MSKKLLSIVLIIFLVCISLNFAARNCPDYADAKEEFVEILRAALQDRLQDPTEDEVYTNEVKDLQLFYRFSADWSAVDCGIKGKYSGMTVKEILDDVSQRTKDVEILECKDGTEYGRCASDPPKYCFFGKLVDRCSICGCPSGFTCEVSVCKAKYQCEDGTRYGECSETKPKYCDDGVLVDNCELCGCPLNEECDFDAQDCFVPEKPTCPIVYDGMIIKKDTLLCTSEYQLPLGIKIGKDSITLDCNGATIEGLGQGEGISLEKHSFVTIRNCKIYNYEKGMFLIESSNNVIEFNEFSNNQDAIFLKDSNNQDITNNIFNHNLAFNFYLEHSMNNIILNNEIYGSTIFDDEEKNNVYCRGGEKNSYYAGAIGHVCILANCGNNICDGDEDCSSCAEDCGCEEGFLCINKVCEELKLEI